MIKAVITLLFIFIILPQITLAHIWESDGSIRALLHIYPLDEPFAGDISTPTFTFNDTTEKFTLLNCQCTLTIFLNKSRILVTPLIADDPKYPLRAALDYAFPQKGVYSLIVHGVSKNNTYVPFTLTYAIRVDKESVQKSQGNTWVLAVVILCVIIGIYSIFFQKRKR